MDKVLNMFTPIRAKITPNGGAMNPGSIVTIDTNVPATVVYSLDGSEPSIGNLGTFRADAPVSVELRVSARVRFFAFDNRSGQSFNVTRRAEATFTIDRTNPLESFRDTSFFFRKLVTNIVDENFYLTEGRWLVPTSSFPFTYDFVNRQPFPVFLRVIHNGVDIFSNFPVVGVNESKEVTIRPISGDNTIEIQTEQAGQTALYDIGRYDVDVYA